MPEKKEFEIESKLLNSLFRKSCADDLGTFLNSEMMSMITSLTSLAIFLASLNLKLAAS